jgi:hypothetical protein
MAQKGMLKILIKNIIKQPGPVGAGLVPVLCRSSPVRAGLCRLMPVPVGTGAGVGTGTPRCQPVPIPVTDRKKRCRFASTEYSLIQIISNVETDKTNNYETFKRQFQQKPPDLESRWSADRLGTNFFGFLMQK